MKERINHFCACLQKAFTFSEWTAYLKEHPNSGSEQVFTYNGFGWNIYDVCVNPRAVIQWGTGDCKFNINIVQCPNGRWMYGYECCFHWMSRLTGAHFITDPNNGYVSEKEAIYHALECIERSCERELDETINRIEIDDDGEPIKNSSVVPRLNKALFQIGKYKDIFNPKQMSLFD